jgi:hypothetical protein
MRMFAVMLPLLCALALELLVLFRPFFFALFCPSRPNLPRQATVSNLSFRPSRDCVPSMCVDIPKKRGKEHKARQEKSTKINLNLSSKVSAEGRESSTRRKLSSSRRPTRSSSFACCSLAHTRFLCFFRCYFSHLPYLNMLEAAKGRLKSLSSCDERLWIPAIVV